MAYKEVELDKNGAKALMDSWSDANAMVLKNGKKKRSAAKSKGAAKKAGGRK